MQSPLFTRYMLVCLFFPFSALDKVLNFKGATQKAREFVSSETLAVVMIVGGLIIEILMPLAILTGKADRFAAVVMASYCCITAVLWKRFWEPGDFWQREGNRGRDLLWDFLKNFSLAGGFLMLALGLHQGDFANLIKHPLASSRPYRVRRIATDTTAMPTGPAQQP